MPASIAYLPRKPLQTSALNPMHPRPMFLNPKHPPAIVTQPSVARTQFNPKLHRSVGTLQVTPPQPERSAKPATPSAPPSYDAQPDGT